MKKLLTIAAIAAASTALAVESSNTFGILKVTIPVGQQNTVIAAPWCDAGATGDAEKAIKVKDIVKTANLTPATTDPVKAGDKIYVFNGNEYSAAFELQTVGGVVQWVGIQIVKADSSVIPAPSADLTIQRGQAIGLVLTEAPTVAKDIYLYGQYTTVAASTTIVAPIEGVSAVYTLVAPTGVANDTTLNSEWLTAQTGLTPVAGDQVFVPGKGFYPFSSGNGFGVTTPGAFNPSTGSWGTPSFTAATVPTGTGFWYISKGGSGTINL